MHRDEELGLEPRAHLVVERVLLGAVFPKVSILYRFPRALLNVFFCRYRSTLVNAEAEGFLVPLRPWRMLGS